MKKTSYILFTLLLGCATFAQSNDTLWMPGMIDHHVMKDLQWSSPIQASRLDYSNYTLSGINAQFSDQKLKRVQTADKIQNYQFVTEGIYQINDKIRVFGDFTIDKEIEKGLAFNLSSDRTTHTKVLKPNYYYSPAKGDWDNQKYNFKGGGSYEFAKNAYFGAIVDYDAFLLARSIDPRPKNSGNDIAYQLQFGYQFQKHLVSVNYAASVRKEENSIYYENKTLNPSTNPDAYIRFSSGYGYNIYNSYYSLYLDKNKTNGFGVDYSYKNENHFVSFGYDYETSDRNYYVSNSNAGTNTRPVEDALFVKYNQSTKTNYVHAFYKNLSESLPLELILMYKASEWTNYVAETKSSNAIAKENNLFVQGNYRLRNSWINYLGLKANYNSIDVKDYLGVTEKVNNSLDFTIFTQKNFNINSHRLFAHFGLGMIAPITNDLVYKPAAQDQDFANNVILKDDIYDGITKWKGEIIVAYDLPAKNNNTVRFKTYYNFVNGSSNEQINGFLMKGTSSYYGLGVSILY